MTQKCMRPDHVMEAMRHKLVMDAISQDHVADGDYVTSAGSRGYETLAYILKAMRHKHVMRRKHVVGG